MRIQPVLDLPDRSGARRFRTVALSGCIAVAAVMIVWSSVSLSGAGLVVLTALLAAGIALLLPMTFRASKNRSVEAAAETVPLAAVGDLVTWHDAFGDVVRASSASQAMLGVSPATLVGGGLLGRVHVSDRPAFLKALSDAANGSGAVTAEIRLHAENRAASRSSVIFAELRALHVQEAAAGGGTVIAFLQDVSARHRHQKELEAARHDAERANELKGRFLATVTHELRTPLNAIIGFSDLLSADHPFLVTEDRRKEYAQIIKSSGLHLLEIVNTLLDMSKIESGNFHFEPEPFAFGDLASSVCDLMQLKADEAGVVIIRNVGRDLPDVTADRRACRQILINLLSNAVKFTPRGGEVSVSIGATSGSLVLTVADTGIGIPEADLPRLGDPFFQAGDLHRRNHEGTGLGLSVVRGIVGLHHGQIAVESGAEAGTTVTVTLPLRPDLAPEGAKPVVVQTRPRVVSRPAQRRIA
ncbi:PAS domain-containing sensor histidine kinase [Enterovirga rhinocerotis]|uniref:histidine kinase n=1 Tax=Enterovirga rhinocerotis TaxID=1339210 RepID=A0A4R7BTW0_9HYPH|nr:PAS domain-containing sensor histidine kinase [Enterovirga rhinocerotis]TDR88941.1 signal transduction histidine kinase [Enterovirga rhinocerotis]